MEPQGTIWQDENLIQTLTEGGVVVMPTDTVYGIVCKADNKTAVNRIYTIRKRDTEKPCIILIGEIKDLEKFKIELSQEQRDVLPKYWPGPVSIGFDCLSEGLAYLHRGTKSLAFRIPASDVLQKFLKDVGPLIAPSANKEGFPVAKNIGEAKLYFDESVDMYVNGGEIISSPSKIIKLDKSGVVSVLRD